jgi:hypothetical protein
MILIFRNSQDPKLLFKYCNHLYNKIGKFKETHFGHLGIREEKKSGIPLEERSLMD